MKIGSSSALAKRMDHIQIMSTRAVRAAFMLSVLLAPGESLRADRYRVTCSDIVGSRVQHNANPLIIPDEYGKNKIEDDAVLGMTIDVTFRLFILTLPSSCTATKIPSVGFLITEQYL